MEQVVSHSRVPALELIGAQPRLKCMGTKGSENHAERSE
jgi:hypothetical protein